MKNNAKLNKYSFIYALLITAFTFNTSYAEDEILFEQDNGQVIRIDLNKSQNSDRLYYYNNGDVTINNNLNQQEEVLFYKEPEPYIPAPRIDSWMRIVQNNRKNYEEIEQRLKQGQNVNKGVIHGNNLLLLGVMQNNIKQVKLALKYKANIHTVNNNGETPTYWASYNANIEILNILFTSDDKNPKSDINKVNKDGLTPLHGAAFNRNSSDAIMYLIVNGADQNLTDKNGQTPAHYSAALGNWDNLEALTKRGANLLLKDKNDLSVEDMLVDRADIQAMLRFYPYLSPETQTIFSKKLEGYHEKPKTFLDIRKEREAQEEQTNKNKK